MKSKIKKTLLTILGVFIMIILIGCNKTSNVPEGKVRITFIAQLPSNTTDDAEIFIAGDFKHPNMPEWDPGAVEGKAERSGLVATFELLYDKKDLPLTIQYKWTRGTWDHVEKGSKGEEINNRTHTVSKTTTVNNDIKTWADFLDDIPGENTVVGNLDIVRLNDERFPSEGARSRNIRIWTPKDYNFEGNVKYPVIYMQDGQNVFDNKTSFAGEWEIDEAMTNLIAEYNINGAIVVGIDNSSDRMGEYVMDLPFLNGAQGANKTGNYYMDFIVDVVKPYIDENYNTLTDRENTIIGGSSLGGLISLFGGLEHLNIFGTILTFSTSTQLVDNEQLESYFESLDQELLLNTRFFFYVGTSSDGNVDWPNEYQNYLLDLGADIENIKTYIGQGFSHNERAWSTHMPIALEWVFEIEE